VEVVDQLVSAVGVHEGTQLIVSALERASQQTEEGMLGLPARVVAVATPAHSGAMAVAELRRRRLGLEATASEEECAHALSQAVPTRLVYSCSMFSPITMYVLRCMLLRYIFGVGKRTTFEVLVGSTP